jgi:hypothetical protein
MSHVFTIISKNAIRDIHGLILDVQSTIPGMIYQFGEDKTKYQAKYLPDVYACIYQKSTRYLDWESEYKDNRKWYYDVRIPVCSNCCLWELALSLIDKIANVTGGVIYTEDMNEEDDEGLSVDEFSKWKQSFSCEENLSRDIEVTLSLFDFKEEDIVIFGIKYPFTFGKNINKELKSKESPAKEFEKRMLQLQNTVDDKTYSLGSLALVTSHNSGLEYKVRFCPNVPFTLIINSELDYIVFSNPKTKETFMVSAKKVREIMPPECFFDEYSFYVDNVSVGRWDKIMEKAKALHEEI